MPDPITKQLIDKVWDDVQSAVTSGLAMDVPYKTPPPALDTVTTVVANEKIGATGEWKYLEHPDSPGHVRVEQCGAAFDIMHHFDLSYHDLRSPNVEEIRKWACAARRFELRLTLRYFAENGDKKSYPTADELYHADPDGWGQLRCVRFNSGSRTDIPGLWERAGMEPVVKVDFDPQVCGMQALVYRISGGPYVRRPGGLTLSWTPVTHCAAELLLTEQLEFVNVTRSTVIGVRVDSSAPAAAGG